ncbi:MAG: four helix bundle protein [Rickettsiales bacterium]|nr:four helix bundle protein [Rickettsiales bacterium]
MLQVITYIYKANMKEERKKHIIFARENIEILKLYLRVSKDLHILSLKQFVTLSSLVEDISKQLTAWQRSL